MTGGSVVNAEQMVALARKAARSWYERMTPWALRAYTNGRYSLFVLHDGYAWAESSAREHDDLAFRLILTPENVASPYALARALLDSAITVTSSPSDGTGGVYAIYRARVGDRSISLGAITIDEGFGYTEADARKALLDALLPAEATAP